MLLLIVSLLCVTLLSGCGQAETQANVSQTAEGPVHYFVKNTSGNLNVRAETKHNSSLAGVVEDGYSTYLIYRGQSVPGLGPDGVTHMISRPN